MTRYCPSAIRSLNSIKQFELLDSLESLGYTFTLSASSRRRMSFIWQLQNQITQKTFWSMIFWSLTFWSIPAIKILSFEDFSKFFLCEDVLSIGLFCLKAFQHSQTVKISIQVTSKSQNRSRSKSKEFNVYLATGIKPGSNHFLFETFLMILTWLSHKTILFELGESRR